MATRRKQVMAVVSTSTGTQIGLWPNIKLRGFTKQINAGPSECVILIDEMFEYTGGDLQLGNEVEVRIADADSTNQTAGSSAVGLSQSGTRTVFRGYISLIENIVEGQKEEILVHLLGYYTFLGTDYLKSAAATTLYSHGSNGLTTASGSQSAADIGLMARTVIDRFRAEVSTKVFYQTAQVPNTSTTATYRFEQATYKDALEKLRSLAPAGTFYYIDETGRFTFGQKASSPTHTFVFGRHFSSVYVERSLEKVRNVLLLWNGEPVSGNEIYKGYTNTPSITKYGRRAAALVDYGIDNSNGADLIGAKFIADFKDPEVRVICTIIDNNVGDGKGYDIETIQPGDTCRFVGFSTGLTDVFYDNMLITAVYYTLEQVEIEVEVAKTRLIDFQERQGKHIADIQSGGQSIPESYT